MLSGEDEKYEGGRAKMVGGRLAMEERSGVWGVRLN